MRNPLNIALLFESEADLQVNSIKSTDTDPAYHWREPKEINAITQCLESLGHKVWHVGTLENLLHEWQSGKRADLVWNLSVRTISRNRTALSPALLELLQVPYTGCNATIKSLTLNKDHLKPLLEHHGIPTPKWRVYHFPHEPLDRPPWEQIVIKPAAEGNSLGIQTFTRSDNISKLQAHCRHIFRDFRQNCLIEELITGREISIALINGTNEYGIAEVLLPDGSHIGSDIISMALKRRGDINRVSADIQKKSIKEALDQARQLMEILGPIDYATFDFRIDNQKAYLIDINTDATLHPDKTFATAFALNDVSYQKIILSILSSAKRRWGLE